MDFSGFGRDRSDGSRVLLLGCRPQERRCPDDWVIGICHAAALDSQLDTFRRPTFNHLDVPGDAVDYRRCGDRLAAGTRGRDGTPAGIESSGFLTLIREKI